MMDKENIRVLQNKDEPKVAYVDGRILPPLSYSKGLERTTYELVPRESDITVVEYPKSGITWLQYICLQLLRDDFLSESVQEIPYHTCLVNFTGEIMANSPNLPQDEEEALINSSQRLIKSHRKFEEIPYSPIGKYIYIARNPKDNLLSYYNHHKIFKAYNWPDGKFDAFFQMFLEKRLPFGDSFDHLLSMLKYKDMPNVLVIRYEDMLADLPGEIKKIGQFIGGKAAEKVADPLILEKIAKASTADAMKKKQEVFFGTKGYHDGKAVFMQNACSKKWKTVFSKDQSDMVDALFKNTFGTTEIAHWWKDELKW